EVAVQRGSKGLAPVRAPAMIGPAAPRSGAAPDGTRTKGTRADSSRAEGSRAESIALANGGLVHPHLLWVQEHLHHLSQSAQTVSEPAFRVAEVRRRPWWR